MTIPIDRPRFDRDGFLPVERIIDPDLLPTLRDRFERLFRGEFETGVAPDEVNWLQGRDDPGLTRQICNGWRADRAVARVVQSETIGRAIAGLAGWPGARLIQDNLLWKPPGARSLGFHRDNAYLAWYRPREMFTCWIALDETSTDGGTIEFAIGSHRWSTDNDPDAEFHDPLDHRASVTAAARARKRDGPGTDHRLRIHPVEVPAGGGSFHHGWLWHGSGPNRTDRHRRALVVHCASSEARFNRPGFDSGTGPTYSRYAHPDDDVMDERHFPILWRFDGHRTPGLPD